MLHWLQLNVLFTAGRHLKRIECLPKGISPCTLLLSNNEISKVENLQYFAHLQQVRTMPLFILWTFVSFSASCKSAFYTYLLFILFWVNYFKWNLLQKILLEIWNQGHALYIATFGKDKDPQIWMWYTVCGSRKSIPPPRKGFFQLSSIHFLTIFGLWDHPHPQEFPIFLWGGGGGSMDIFWNQTICFYVKLPIVYMYI